MVFTEKDVETLTFGDKLKKERESLGWSIKKVAQNLNIQSKYLECLENEEFNLLPAEIYVKGFLRRYAKILELNEEEIIFEYKEKTRLVKHLAKEKFPVLPVLFSPRFVFTPKVFSLALGILFFFLVAGYFFYQLNFLISPPKLTVLQPANDFSTSEKILEILGQTEQETKLTINNQEVYIDKDGNFKETFNLSLGLNLIKVEATNRFGKTQRVVRQVILK